MMIKINKELFRLYKNIDRKYPLIGYIMRKIKYKNIFNTVKQKINGSGNKITYRRSILSSVTIEIKGNNNRIDIAESCYLNKVSFNLYGNNHSVQIGYGCRFNRGGSLWMEDCNGLIQIGDHTTFEDVHLAVTEPESQLVIGSDCMFAYDIDVRTGDSHSIIDQNSHERINYAQNVTIGDHVWIGAHSSVLKGSIIPDNCVIGTRSVITKVFNESHAVIAGIPARIVKQNIDWLRERIQ